MVGGLTVAGALCIGVIFLKVTIDPVELWASPLSQSRKEKDDFDKNFNPFYRTTQVIIHAEGLEQVRFEHIIPHWRRLAVFVQF